MDSRVARDIGRIFVNRCGTAETRTSNRGLSKAEAIALTREKAKDKNFSTAPLRGNDRSYGLALHAESFPRLESREIVCLKSSFEH